MRFKFTYFLGTSCLFHNRFNELILERLFLFVCCFGVVGFFFFAILFYAVGTRLTKALCVHLVLLFYRYFSRLLI